MLAELKDQSVKLDYKKLAEHMGPGTLRCATHPPALTQGNAPTLSSFDFGY
jgi:hypothetical protein